MFKWALDCSLFVKWNILGAAKGPITVPYTNITEYN